MPAAAAAAKGAKLKSKKEVIAGRGKLNQIVTAESALPANLPAQSYAQSMPATADRKIHYSGRKGGVSNPQTDDAGNEPVPRTPNAPPKGSIATEVVPTARPRATGTASSGLRAEKSGPSTRGAEKDDIVSSPF